MRVHQGRTEINSYWQLEFPDRKQDLIDKPFPIGEPLHLGKVNEIIERLYSLLVDSTRIRLRADIPVGAYLSGGLDSSIITHIICKETPTPIETFSITFSDEQYDESKFQAEMASHLGAKHHTIHVTPQKIGQIFPDVIWHTEIPILRTSPAPMYLLSKLVNDNNYKVVLTGEGADEFFCGYNIYKETKIRNFWAMNPDSNKRPLLLKRLYPYISNFSDRHFNFLLAFYKQGLTDTSNPYFSHHSRWRTTGQNKRLFSRQIKDELDIDPNLEIGTAAKDRQVDISTNFHKWDFIQKAQYLECTIFMSQYLLSSQGDRMAMANSVEGRFPFLDHHLIEFTNQIPTQLKLFALNEKFILKKMATKFIPECISQRPKQPYRAPITESFLGDNTLDYFDEVLSNKYLKETGLFEPKAVQILMRKARKTRRLSESNEMAITGIISSQLLHNLFIKNFPTITPITNNDDIKVVYDNE
jgi:asparagine synthase (glutamine-hydrolysing)